MERKIVNLGKLLDELENSGKSEMPFSMRFWYKYKCLSL